MSASTLPVPGPPRDATLPAPVERVLDNGLRVVAFAQRNLPLIAAQLVVRCGAAAEREDEAGLSALVAALLTQGTTARGAVELAATADAGAEVVYDLAGGDFVERSWRCTARGGRYLAVGFADDDEAKTVRPVAFAGFEEAYARRVRVTWADEPRGNGPTGTAIRKGHAVICRDILMDDKFAPWRDEAIERGYASTIALPSGSQARP